METEDNSIDSNKIKEMINEAIEQVKIRLKSTGNQRKSTHKYPKQKF